MSWDNGTVKSNHRGLLAALGMLGLLAIPAPALAGIVVASSGPSAGRYPAGTKLPDDASITLQAADSVTVLTARGTRVLKGQGTFTVGAPPGPNRTATFAALTRQRSATRVRTGAVRAGSADGVPQRPNLWYVDVTVPGPVCVADPSQVRAWRPGKDGQETLGLTPTQGGASGALAFADGSMVAAWDTQAAPVAENAAYTIAGSRGAPAVQVSFRLLPQADLPPEELAGALIAHGCEGQLQVLVEATALPTE